MIIIPSDVTPNIQAVESLTAGVSTPQNADPTAAPKVALKND